MGAGALRHRVHGEPLPPAAAHATRRVGITRSRPNGSRLQPVLDADPPNRPRRNALRLERHRPVCLQSLGPRNALRRSRSGGTARLLDGWHHQTTAGTGPWGRQPFLPGSVIPSDNPVARLPVTSWVLLYLCFETVSTQGIGKAGAGRSKPGRGAAITLQT